MRDDPERQPDPGQLVQGEVPRGDHGGEGLHPGHRPRALPQEEAHHLPADQVKPGGLESARAQITDARYTNHD